jgi:hypothetical protein
MKLTELSDAQLLQSLKTLCAQGRVVLARLLAHLVEVEERRLYLEAACPSMLQFCVLRLGMSEDEACRRIHAARLARRFPDLLARIERGGLTLSTIGLLRVALTESNYEEFVEAAAGKTKAQVQALVATRAPSPDVPPTITPIPVQQTLSSTGTAPASPSHAGAAGPQLSPLSQTRHKVQFTASDQLRNKIERARDLMRHANATGDLAVVVERAMDLLLEKLERHRLGKTTRPRAAESLEPPVPPEPPESRGSQATASVPRPSGSGEPPAPPAPSHIPRATRRAVFERDGVRCTFTDAEGNRCPSTTFLELDHIIARARGGSDDLANLRVRCRAHNHLHAEQTFGKHHVARKIRERRDPSRRGYPSETYAIAASGLENLGFPRAEVRRALGAVSAHHRNDAPGTMPVQTVLREALAVLA